MASTKAFLIHFFDEVVPAYEHYVELSKKKDNKKSALKGAAKNAAGYLFGFREYLIPPFKKKEFTRAHVAEMHPDFDWIADAYNALRHNELTQNLDSVIINHHSQIEETIVKTYFHHPDTSNPRQFYEYEDMRILINPSPGKGPVRDVLEIATSVVNFWSQFLVEKGYTDKLLQYRYEGDDILSHEEVERRGMKALLKPGYDGFHGAVIARYYEPLTNTFNRWGFLDGGVLLAVQVPEDSPNAKTYLTVKA